MNSTLRVSISFATLKLLRKFGFVLPKSLVALLLIKVGMASFGLVDPGLASRRDKISESPFSP
jgi:hypothetical protein